MGAGNQKAYCAALHGFTGGAEDWEEVFEDLSSVFLPALPGHRYGPALEGQDWASVVRLLYAQIDTSTRKPACLIGYSMGARLALSVALENPSRFSSVVLIGVNPGLRTEGERICRRKEEAELIQYLRREGIDAFVSKWERNKVLALGREVAPKRLVQKRQQRLNQDPQSLAMAIEVLGLSQMPSCWSRLSEVPLTFVVGARDSKFLALTREALRMHSHLRMEVVPEAGHNLLLETPTEIRNILSRYCIEQDKASS